MRFPSYEFVRILAAISILPADSVYVIRRWAQGGQFQKDDVRIDNKVVVITGGNGGIGRETALDLAKRGAKIYLACRNLEKAEPIRQDIINKSNNTNVYVMKIDLASFKSVYEFAEKFKKIESKLHILINNAGVMAIPERQITKDGLEMQIGINYFGHFLLTKLLLDMMKNSAPARIINVSSIAHFMGSINRNDLQMKRSYSRWGAYSQSKLANVLFTRELAKQLQGTKVTVNSLHPGVVDTNLIDKTTFLDRLILPPKILQKTPKSGAQTSIMLAVDPDVSDVTGKYFADCSITFESLASLDEDTAVWLWKESERIVQPFLRKQQKNRTILSAL